MSEPLSKSEKKRRAKAIEQLAQELVDLRTRDISQLPCNDEIKDEIRAASTMKGGARKRQTKYITRLLRDEPTDDMLAFLRQRKGSHLEATREHHELEYIRDTLINEAIAMYDDAQEEDGWFTGTPEQPPMPAELRQSIIRDGANADPRELWNLAWQFARSHRIEASREIYRILKAAREQERFAQQQPKEPQE